jgi:hypothetical protein
MGISSNSNSCTTVLDLDFKYTIEIGPLEIMRPIDFKSKSTNIKVDLELKPAREYTYKTQSCNPLSVPSGSNPKSGEKPMRKLLLAATALIGLAASPGQRVANAPNERRNPSNTTVLLSYKLYALSDTKHCDCAEHVDRQAR